MVTFETHLSLKSLNATIKKIKNYKKELEDSKTAIHEALANYAYSVIMANCPVDTGNLKSSFIIEASNQMATVYTECEYAKYVEFGTGIRGNTSAYPIEQANIIVSNGWKGYSSIVQGQSAHKFMLRAWESLQKEGPNIIKKVLRERGLL